jgi:protocatechuate 3,4-dioxygenase beta subunit
VRSTFSLVVLLLLTGAPSSASVQVLYRSLVGNVADETGSPVPGATVTITQSETGASHHAITDSVGTYHFTNVQTGSAWSTAARRRARTATAIR